MNNGNSIQYTTNYYPSGIQVEGHQLNSDYAFGGKELQSSHAVNLYDFEARYYDPVFGFIMMDQLCEKYYGVSPYSYCAGNPVNNVDLKGDSVTVLNVGNNGQHIALLIQNSNGKWGYFSVNGNNVYISGNIQEEENLMI